MPKARTTRQAPGAPQARDLRGDDTRDRLLAAGLRLFGRHGVTGVSTRELAQQAGVNLAAIPYHYGSKEGVYLAVAQRVVDTVKEEILPAVEQANRDIDRQPEDRDALISALVRMMTSTIRALSRNPDRLSVSLYIAREQMQPSEAFKILYEGFMMPVSATYTRLVATLRKLPADDPRVGIEVQMLVGQVLIFSVGREALLRRMHWKDLAEKQVEQIEAVVEDVMHRQFAAS